MKKVCKQVRDQIIWKQVEKAAQVCYGMEMNSKSFNVPILTAILSTINQMQSEYGQQMLWNLFRSIATLELCLQPLFPYCLIPNLFAHFSLSIPIPFFKICRFLKSFLFLVSLVLSCLFSMLYVATTSVVI